MKKVTYSTLLFVCLMCPVTVSAGLSDIFNVVKDAVPTVVPKNTQDKPQAQKSGNGNVAGKLAIQGCFAGGLGGALLSNVMGKKASTNRKTAAIGCLAGAVVGYQVGKRTQQYANENQALQKETQRNKRLTKELRGVNKKLLINISDYKLQIASLRRSQLSQQEKKTYLQKTKQVVTRQINTSKNILRDINNDIVVARKNINRYSKKSTPQQRKNWQNTIIALERERSLLNRNVHQLTAIGNSI